MATNGQDGSIEPFKDRVARLAGERGLSVSEVRFRAYKPGVKGTNPETIKSAMDGRRPLRVSMLEAVAEALDVPPEEFPEYRLAVARRQLDEREVGLEQALAFLEALEAL